MTMLSEQYRITSADFVTPGESLETDAVLSPEDLAMVKTMVSSSGSILAHKMMAAHQQLDLFAAPEQLTEINHHHGKQHI